MYFKKHFTPIPNTFWQAIKTLQKDMCPCEGGLTTMYLRALCFLPFYGSTTSKRVGSSSCWFEDKAETLCTFDFAGVFFSPLKIFTVSFWKNLSIQFSYHIWDETVPLRPWTEWNFACRGDLTGSVWIFILRTLAQVPARETADV